MRVHISDLSLLLSTTIYLHRYPSTSITMPIDLSNLSAEDIAAATAAMEAARRAREEREHQEVEERWRRQEEERVRQEVTMWSEAEERKEAAAWKAAAEQRDCLAQEKATWEAAAAEEQRRQSLAMGFSGLTLTIPAPASIARMASGLSTQSKGKRGVMEEELSTSQYVPFFIFRASLILSVGQSFRLATCACLLGLLV
jgi:hypothetical protein